MRQLFVYFLLFFCFFSCKEEKDELPPSINFSLPSENSRVDVLDEIEVKATISDNEVIKTVVLSLISLENRNVVLNSVRFEPNASTFELNHFFGLSDSLLSGGEYYFQVQASDEDNTISAFKSIFINAYPRRKISTIVSTSNNSSSELFEDANNFQFNLIHTFSGPLHSSELNSFHQQYWFFPSSGNQLEVLDLREKNIDFSKSFISNLTQTFSSSDLHSQDVFIALKTGELRAYNSSFQNRYSYQSTQQKQLEKIRVGDNFVLQEEAFPSGRDRSLQLLFRSSGLVRNTVSLSEAVVDLHFLSEEKAILFQNDLDGGLIQELSINNINLRKVRSLRDSVTSVEQINSNLYLIATKTKILQYNSLTDNLVDYLILPNAVMAYDEPNNQIYISEGNQLRLYALGSTSELTTASFSDNIRSIHFRYNY